MSMMVGERVRHRDTHKLGHVIKEDSVTKMCHVVWTDGSPPEWVHMSKLLIWR